MAQEKEYTGTFTLGAITPTYDLESEPMNLKDFSHLTKEEIEHASKQFMGEIQQVPPIHSAIKVGGQPVYKLARKGKEIQLEPRTVAIKEFQISTINLPVVEFRVVCSTGTYIRSLANDFGAALGVGGYLSQLCRTRIGNFHVKDALTIPEVEKWIREKNEMQ